MFDLTEKHLLCARDGSVVAQMDVEVGRHKTVRRYSLPGESSLVASTVVDLMPTLNVPKNRSFLYWGKGADDNHLYKEESN